MLLKNIWETWKKSSAAHHRIILEYKMKKIFVFFLFVTIFMISLSGSENTASFTYLVGGDLLDVTEGKITPDSLVIIDGDTITYAGPNKTFEKSPDDMVIDCSGKTILPGLFDAHIHLGGASTLGYVYTEDARKLSAFLYSGVTSVFDLGAVPELIFELREAEKIYPCWWIEEAFRIAATHNKRSWRYIRAILERWHTEGKDDETNRRPAEQDGRRYLEGEYGEFIQH